MLLVNLLPWRENNLKRILRRWLCGGGLGLVITLMLCLAYVLVSVRVNAQLREEINAWQLAGQQAVALSQRLHSALQAQQQLQARQLRQQQQRERAHAWLQFVQQLATWMPENVWLTVLKKSSDALSITGMSDAFIDVSAFQQRLSQQPLFQQASNSGVERQQSGYLRFNMRAKLAPGIHHE